MLVVQGHADAVRLPALLVPAARPGDVWLLVVCRARRRLVVAVTGAVAVHCNKERNVSKQAVIHPKSDMIDIC